MFATRRDRLLLLSGVGVLLPVLLLMLTYVAGAAAAEHPAYTVANASPASSVITRQMTLLGVYSPTTLGAINASGNRVYAAYQGLRVLDVSAATNVHEIGYRATPNGGIEAIARDGGLLYVAVGRPIGLGGDYLELVSNSPITSPALLGAYYPPTISGFPVTSIFDVGYIDYSAPELYVAESTGLTVLDRFAVAPNGRLPVLGHHDADVVRQLALSEQLIGLETDAGLEFLQPGSAPQLLGSLAAPGRGRSIQFVGDYLYRSREGYDSLHIIDAGDPAAPTLVLTRTNFAVAYQMRLVGTLLYAAQGSDGVGVYFVGDPLNPLEVGRYQEDDFSAVHLDAWGNIYATGSVGEGLRILQFAGELPTLQATANGPGVKIDNQDLTVGETTTLMTSTTVHNGSIDARLALNGECEELLVLLVLLHTYLSSLDENPGGVAFDPFDFFVDVLAVSPTLCEPSVRPSGIAADPTEARIDLRLENGGIRTDGRFGGLLLNIATPLANVTSRGANDFGVAHDAATATTTVRSLRGAINVQPLTAAADPFTLPAGYQVTLSEDEIATPQFVGTLYLPLVAQ